MNPSETPSEPPAEAVPPPAPVDAMEALGLRVQLSFPDLVAVSPPPKVESPD